MTSFTITPLYAGILGLFYLYLAFQVIRRRMGKGVGLGDGGHPDLTRAIRVHANFAEYVPLALILLLMLEGQGYSPWFVHVLGVLLVFARLAHAHGLSQSDGHSRGRFLGTATTLFVVGSASLLVILGTIVLL